MSTTVKRALWAALSLYTALHLGYSVMRYSVFEKGSSGDFHRVWEEATDWKATLESGKNPEGILHPPLYYMILLKIGALCGGRFQTALFFYFLQFLLFPIAVWLMVQTAWKTSSGPPPLRAYGFASVLMVNFQPFLETLSQHKVEGIEFFLICLAVWALRGSKEALCGGLIAVAANLKYLPAILLAHLAIQRKWRVLLGAIVAAVFIGGFLWISLGSIALHASPVRNAANMLFSHKSEGTLPEASVEFQTLSGTVNRWLAQPAAGATFMQYILVGSYMPVPQVDLSRRIALVLKLALIGVWLFLLLRRRRVKRQEEPWLPRLLEISFSLVMIFVISQFARVHYLILLLPAFVWTGLQMVHQMNSFRLTDKALFGLAYALTSMLIPGGLLNKLPPHPVWGQLHSWMYLWWSLPFYGALLLGLCILRMHRRTGNQL